MSSPIIGVQAAQRARKKPKTRMYVTPGWTNEAPPPVESREQRFLTDKQKKLKRLQRA